LLNAGENEGAGWSGTYFAVVQIPDTFSATDSLETRAVAAGSMEWGFEEAQVKCLSAESACYALQFAVPSATEEIPQMLIANAYTDATRQHVCPYIMDSSVTLAKFCVGSNYADGLMPVSFYSQIEAWHDNFGQTKVLWGDFISATSGGSISLVGECVFLMPLMGKEEEGSNDMQPTLNPSIFDEGKQ
jgi:hypothetical protein